MSRLIRANNPLVTEIKNKEDWECLITYNTGPYTASANKSEDTVKADVKIPGKDSDQATDVRQKNETSTYHEMVHARAIFKNEFDLGPKIYHTVYRNNVFHGREAIPLEEALTVGFQNDDQDKHSLHTIDMKNLSELTDEEWTAFAPKLKNRYKRIYANAEAAEQSGATENKYRQGGKRIYYAPERTNNDEAWMGDGSQGSTKLMKEGYKEMLEENKKRIADLKKWYDTYSSVSWNELKQKIQTKLTGEMYGDLREFASGIEQQKWTEYKQDFSAKYTEIQTLFTDLKEGGDLMKWASFKKKSNELLEAAKVLERILKGLDLADHPVEFSLF